MPWSVVVVEPARSWLHELRRSDRSRPGSGGGSEIRLLFVFDPARQAVLLVGGDKAGNWSGWYRTAVPLAESAYAEHLRRMHDKDGDQ